MTKGSIFQSEDMMLCQVILPKEMVYTCVRELGETGKLYFRDLNPDINAYSRVFVSEVRRCDEVEKEIRYLSKELHRNGQKMKNSQEIPSAPAPSELSELESEIMKLAEEMRAVGANAEALNSNMVQLYELKYILEKTAHFFDEIELDLTIAISDMDNIVPNPEISPSEFGHVTGVILHEKVNGFEQMLWRVCRGNVHMRHEVIELNLEDPQTGERVYKSAFIVLFHGEHLRERVKKICDGFHATLYAVPDMAEDRKESLTGVRTRIEDLTMVLSQTHEHRTSILTKVFVNLRNWMIKIRKIKAIYHVMNQLDVDVNQMVLIGEGWVPVLDLERVQDALTRGQIASGCDLAPIINRMDHHLNPPTFFRTNKFTKIFQSIVNAYGVPRYKEVNPALYTIITFPFLFSVMFGDAGDAIIIIILASLLIVFEKKIAALGEQGVFNMFFSGRYIIFLMGVFSLFSGVMYNDFFSKSVNIFGTCWFPSLSTYQIATDLREVNTFELNPNPQTDYSGAPYPFGMDPVWQLAQNSITWLNSFKMKMSVIMGVSQMFFGICLSLVNGIYFRNAINIVCEFIPQVIFIACIFGYMNILIVYKWFAYDAATSSCAPTILVDMIDMFLMQYPNPDDSPCYSTTFYPDQKKIQCILLICVVICVPWILIPKPLLLRHKHNKELALKEQASLGGDFEVELGMTAGSYTTVDATAVSVVGADGIESVEMKPPSSTTVLHPSAMNPAQKAKFMEAKESVVPPSSGEERRTSEIDFVFNKDKVAAKVVPEVEMSKAYRSRPDEFDEEPFEFSEVFVHQAIHTIEYCLGCISHTASYLRLWALSLAHAELAEVLWDMILHFAFATKGYGGILAQFLLFPTWAVLTIAILLMMEGLSAFLHTLRLHWVEFQSKFYGGSGHKFLPFSFKSLLKAMREEYREALS